MKITTMTYNESFGLLGWAAGAAAAGVSADAGVSAAAGKASVAYRARRSSIVLTPAFVRTRGAVG